MQRKNKVINAVIIRDVLPVEFSETALCSIYLWSSVLECFLLLQSRCHRGPKKSVTYVNPEIILKTTFTEHIINSNNPSLGINNIASPNPINCNHVKNISRDLNDELYKEDRSCVIKDSKWFHRIFSAVQSPTPTDTFSIQADGFLSARCSNPKENVRGTGTVFHLINAAVGEHKSWSGLHSQPDSLFKRKNF